MHVHLSFVLSNDFLFLWCHSVNDQAKVDLEYQKIIKKGTKEPKSNNDEIMGQSLALKSCEKSNSKKNVVNESPE